MNNDQDLERLIDEAAWQMAHHEPSDALVGAVMARVAVGATPSTLRRLAWGSVAAAVAVVLMVVQLHRPAPSAEGPTPVQGSGLRAQGPAVTQGTGVRAEGAGQRAEGTRLRAQGVAEGPDEVEQGELAQIDDSMVFDVITPALIEVERLDVPLATTVAAIEIAPLEIEPISTSND